MREMDAGVAEADARVRRRQQHLRARLVVAGIVEGAHEIAGDQAQRLQRPDVADRVRALVGGTQCRAIRAGAIRVRQRGEAFDRVEQARETIAREGLFFKNSLGEPRRHPASVVEKDNIALLARLIRELDLDRESLPQPKQPPALISNRRGHAG